MTFPGQCFCDSIQAVTCRASSTYGFPPLLVVNSNEGKLQFSSDQMKSSVVLIVSVCLYSGMRLQCVHLCNPCSATGSSDFLQGAVSNAVFWVARSLPLPVVRIASAPVLLALPLVGFVVGIGVELVSLPGALPRTLAFFLPAIALVLDAMVWNKQAVTMSTTELVHGFSPPRNHKEDPCRDQSKKDLRL